MHGVPSGDVEAHMEEMRGSFRVTQTFASKSTVVDGNAVVVVMGTADVVVMGTADVVVMGTADVSGTVLDASFVLCSDTGVTVFAVVSVRADSACSLPAPDSAGELLSGAMALVFASVSVRAGSACSLPAADSAGELLSGAMAFATADGLFSGGNVPASSGFAETRATKKNSRIEIKNKRGAMARLL